MTDTWSGGHLEPRAWELFLYDGTRTTQITDNDYDERSYQINNQGHVVWNADEVRSFWAFRATSSMRKSVFLLPIQRI